MGEALYRRLGGAERIAAIVEEAIDRHAVNPVLAPRLRGKDLPRLARVGTRLFCAGIGGPAQHSGGGDLRSACARLGISEPEYLATMGDIVAALASQGVAQTERVEVVAILDSLKGEMLGM